MEHVQYLTPEYIKQCQAMSPEERLRFLDDYGKLHAARKKQPNDLSKKVPSKLISLKVPEDLLAMFRRRCELEGVKYQTQIKHLMRSYLESDE